MPRYIFTEWFGGERVRKFIVWNPSPSEPNFYRNTVSLDAFRSRELKRCFGPKANPKNRNGRRFNMQHEEEYEIDLERLRNCQYRDVLRDQIMFIENLPTLHAVDIWDFYKQINYDYKKRKFL